MCDLNRTGYTTLSNHLAKYSGSTTSFHMPGHKFGKINPLNNIDVYQIDATEVDETDNLFHPEGIIKDALSYAKNVYKTKETFYLVNGSSVGILASIASVTHKGDEILIGRNCHRSVFNGVILNELNPTYYYPEYIDELSIYGGISPSKIENILMKNDRIKAVVITSPTYHGIVSDINEIARIVHQYNRVLIVDEAHGAHFNFSEYYPKSAIQQGADIVIQSLHKTLPSLTQTALLHVNSNRIDMDRVKRYLEIYQSSSPSYVLMSSIDSCISYMHEHSKDKNLAYINILTSFRERAGRLKNLKLMDKAYIGRYSIYDIDLSKIAIFSQNILLKGKDLEQILKDKYNIQIEMSMTNGLLLISTIADDQEDFLRLIDAFEYIDGVLGDKIQVNEKEINYTNNNLDAIIKGDAIMELLPSVAFHAFSKEIGLYEAENYISSEYIQVYPPGIPLIVPGELITKKLINQIKEYLNHNLTVIGVHNNRIKVVNDLGGSYER